MNSRRTIVALLATIAVLLTLNLVKGERRAEALGANGSVGSGDPYVAKYHVRSPTEYFRIWSDGQIDVLSRPVEGCAFTLDRVLVPPSGHSSVVIDADYRETAFTLTYVDGRVDHIATATEHTCTIAGEGSDPFCLGDIDRSGDTNFDDLLFVLRDWGKCE